MPTKRLHDVLIPQKKFKKVENFYYILTYYLPTEHWITILISNNFQVLADSD